MNVEYIDYEISQSTNCKPINYNEPLFLSPELKPMRNVETPFNYEEMIKATRPKNFNMRKTCNIDDNYICNLKQEECILPPEQVILATYNDYLKYKELYEKNKLEEQSSNNKE